MASCETYEFNAPDCYLITDPLETPYLWEVEDDPIVKLSLGDRFTHLILQRRMRGGGEFCTSSRNDCVNTVYQHTYDKLFRIDFKRPKKLEDLMNSIGIDTPLLSVDELKNQVDPTTHMGLVIFDSCRNPYYPIDSEVSSTFYNRITDVVETDRIEYDDHQSIDVEVFGVLTARFEIQGEIIQVTAEYRMEQYIVEY